MMKTVRRFALRRAAKKGGTLTLAYLDNSATTRVCEEAAQEILYTLTEGYGNPSSLHAKGFEAERLLRQARDRVAGRIGCAPEEVLFTSGGTEANNLAVFGAAQALARRGHRIVTTAIEHPSVEKPMRELERQGYEVTYLRPDREGNIALEELEAALRPDTVLVSMMLVNNELGTVLPVAQAAQLIRRLGGSALIHCDGVQGFLKVPFTPAELGVDLLTVSGHKIHAPKGIGALYVRRGLKLPPLIRGGGQEGGLRSGTEATAQIAAFAAAVRAGAATREADVRHMAELKAETLARLQEAVPGLKPIGSGTAPHILAVTLPGYKSEVIVRFLSDRGICLSSGSACHKGKPSHVYAALKLPKSDLDGALRVSFSYDTTQQDVDALADGLRAAKEQLFPTLS